MQILEVHLPIQNIVIFNDVDDIQDVVSNERNQKTYVSKWFTTNLLHVDAKKVPYMEFSWYRVWKKGERAWTRRKKDNTVGHMYTVSPIVGELNLSGTSTCNIKENSPFV